MKFKNHKLKEIAAIVDAPFFGDAELQVNGINEIHRVEKGDIVFVDHPKYYDKALQSAATVVLINKEVEVPKGKGLIVCEDPFSSFNKVLNHFNPFDFFSKSDQESQNIDASAQVHPSVVLGKNVSIGKGSVIMPHVCIHDNVSIGNNVVIQSGCVIGSFGFYYKNRPSHFDRLMSAGSVEIEDNVEIGANSTIDKGVTAVTKIGKGTKIDNLVQIGHDTIIGEKCLIAANCGIAGCVTVGNEVTFWGQVGVTSGVSIGDKAVITGKSGVSKNLEGGKTYSGVPAEEFRIKYKEMVMLRKLPELMASFSSNEK
jgi:UDP-3-O-[3-hydroxymyristoyl] glucosamine N-acyltransferase